MAVDVTTPSRKQKSRGKGLRTRTGCQSCRTRRVKCDESRPECRACIKAGRACIYVFQQHHAESEQPEAGQNDVEGEEDVPQNGLEQDLDPEPQDISNRPTSPQQSFPLYPSASASQALSVDLATKSQLDNAQSALQDSTSSNDHLQGQHLHEADTFETSPGSAWSGWAHLSAEAASLSWFGLLATDATNETFGVPKPLLTPGSSRPLAGVAETHAQLYTASGSASVQEEAALISPYVSRDEVNLSDEELRLFRHFVRHLSGWIDITDPDRCFAVIVPQMALKNRGLMMAILALSARHLSLIPSSASDAATLQLERTSAVQYYYETLKYLQREMEDAAFLRSDELLATVVTISTYEMIDGSSRGWERHLKGVFWIQRSQTIQGESEGLKKRIWWAWLRQDIWVAFKEGRKILSYYQLTRACSSLDFWELVDRAVWLLGQCVNYASSKEARGGRDDVQVRLDSSSRLWDSLNEWYMCFQASDQRLPTAGCAQGSFQPIWINPTQASLAIQVHHFSKLLLLEHTPAMGGLKELTKRQSAVQASVYIICGIACCTEDDGALIVSTQCVYAAGPYVKEPGKRRQVIELLQSHRNQTGWPPYDLGDELRRRWIAEDE